MNTSPDNELGCSLSDDYIAKLLSTHGSAAFGILEQAHTTHNNGSPFLREIVFPPTHGDVMIRFGQKPSLPQLKSPLADHFGFTGDSDEIEEDGVPLSSWF